MDTVCLMDCIQHTDCSADEMPLGKNRKTIFRSQKLQHFFLK